MDDIKNLENQEEIRRLEKLKANLELQAELALRNRLNGMYIEAKLFKDQHASSKWDEFTKFLRGDQWPRRRPSHKISSVLNFLLENIERKTALLTDTKPIPRVVPRADQYQDTADLLNMIMGIIFSDSSFGQENTDLVNNAQVFGSGFMGTYFDFDPIYGRTVKIQSHDPRAVFFDPVVLKSYCLCEGEYVILEDIWPVSKAKDMFPDRADMIKSDATLSRFADKPTFLGRVFSRVWTPRQQQATVSAVPRVYVREYFYKDRSKTNNKLNFKNGCRRTITVGEVIVQDGDNPYNDGQFPQEMLTWHTDYDTAWGWGDVELLKGPQEMHNKLVAVMIENMMLMSNAIWIGDSDALSKEDWNKLNNAPGSYVKKRPGRDLRREPGVQLPPHAFNALEYMERAPEKISGLVDVMRGIRTGQVSSGVGIESLQMMAQALIRLRARSLEALHERIGKKLVSRIFQFYETEKIMEILMLKDKKSSEVKAYDSELLKPISSRRKDAYKDVIFSVEPGSSLSMAKERQQVIAMKLRELNTIDDKALLEAYEYPHREEILDRVEKKRQDAMNAEIEAKSGDKNTQFPHQQGGDRSGGM